MISSNFILNMFAMDMHNLIAPFRKKTLQTTFYFSYIGERPEGSQSIQESLSIESPSAKGPEKNRGTEIGKNN